MKRTLLFFLLIPLSLCASEQNREVTSSHWQLLPAIGHTTESGWILGLLPIWYPAEKSSAEFPSHVEFAAYGTTEGQYKVEAKPKITFGSGSFHLQSENSLLFWPSSYYGRGPFSALTPLSYDAEIAQSHSALLYRARGRFWVGPIATLRFQSLDWHSPALTPQEPGATESREVGFGIKGSYDLRNLRKAPTHGALFSGEWEEFPSWIGNSDPYRRGMIDLRGYTTLLFETVVAVSLFAEQQWGTPPLNALLTPDGKKYLRGFQTDRFRDQALLVLSAELRVPLFWRFLATFFSETGRVDDKISAILQERQGWVQVIGVGGRFQLNREQKLNARGDLSFVSEPDREYFAITIQVGEAF